MKKLLAPSIAALLSLLCLRAEARPVLRNRCLTTSNVYSQITVCSNEDADTGQSYGYFVTYRYGLLGESRQVLLGGIKYENGYSHNIYDGGLDWSNELLSINGDGSGSGGFPGGGVHDRIELYFQIPDGAYDSNYGNNYVFQF
jgi:hypothetical protein